jgi:DNA replication and repair protein RecF
MGLKFLQIEDFRIIKQTKLEPSGKINIICGENAAGKTSLLETIDVLSRGRSFRTSINSHLINKESLSYKIYAQITSKYLTKSWFGVEWAKGEKRLRLDGNPVYKQSIISKLFPVRSMDPQGNNIITGTSKQKRSHIDWGVFHVKPDFNETLQAYQRVLSQKNISLKQYSQSLSISAWDDALSALAVKIDTARSSYVKTLNGYLADLSDTFDNTGKLQLEYKRGWQKDSDLLALLKSRASRLKSLGYVDVGPQVADCEMLAGGKPAKIYASGGQQKLISVTFIMAQIRLLEDITGKHATFLLDDLPSELDHSSRKILLNLLNSWKVQAFVTTHDLNSIPLEMLHDYKLFHVKHGVVREL